jgi:uncharacterized protein (DUF58 family)
VTRLAALVVAAMAGVAFVLSRTSGSGWLVVTSAALIAVLVLSIAWTLAGLVGVRVTLDAPANATAGETLSIGVRITAPVRQTRLLRFHDLDGSSHVVVGNGTGTVSVVAPRRELFAELRLDVVVGFPLGLTPARRMFRIALDPPLAVAPVGAAVSLAHALDADDSASVRTVRTYVRGDARRLVHWRSSARRGDLMVREFESAEPLRGVDLTLRVDLSGDPDAAEATASQAAGLAYAALDAGMRVELLTFESAGPRAGAVHSRRDAGRRLAAAVAGPPPNGAGAGHVIELRG